MNRKIPESLPIGAGRKAIAKTSAGVARLPRLRRVRHALRQASAAIDVSAPWRQLKRWSGRSPLRRVGGMATMPSRASSLAAAIDSIAAQVDVLYVYLDKHVEVPALLKGYRHVIPILPSQLPELLGDRTRELGAAGKFVGTLFAGDCLFFGFDDDIVYPRDYTRRLAGALKRRGYRAVVGIHGCDVRAPHRSYTKDRDVFHFAEALPSDREVDIVGTGTAAFDTRVFRPDFLSWPYTMMLDLLLAIDAHADGLPRIVTQRRKGYLQPIPQAEDDSLWSARVKDDSVESGVMRANPQLWTHRIVSRTP